MEIIRDKTGARPFPVPVVALGAGSQSEEVELDYLVMPQGMQTYAMPILPEPGHLAGLTAAHRALRAIEAAVTAAAGGAAPAPVDLLALDQANLALINQVLGEGEVSARAEPGDGSSIRIQEAIFAGIWRTVTSVDGRVTADQVDIGPVPPVLISAARAGAVGGEALALPDPPPAGIMNAPPLLAELNQYLAAWRPGEAARAINLSLLPLSPGDVALLERQLMGGCVLILSRGYGNCRILSTLVPNCWRVVYYNSSDTILLNTVEVTDIPEVACAAREDLLDSCERLREVLDWVEGA
ncbi:hydrogenase expression/formation protein [Burkholderia sp. LMU1-1-1.1]|uniref:hydrogenase expression/formation protein n=1 Tax=Burkholderia sp. LMU1-1-1.1 TaxID=3135266 RepID=UPI003445659C